MSCCGPFVPGADGAGGSGGGGDSYQRFRYTVTGLEPDPADFMVPLPVAELIDTYQVGATLAGVAAIVGFDCPDLAAGDRTTTEFRFQTTGAMTVGDQIDFVIFSS